MAFNRVIRYWYPRIYNFAYKYFSEHDMAMEVVQQTFISVHKNLQTLQDVTQFRSWLYRIAANCCHQESRRRKRQRIFPFSLWTQQQPTVSLNDCMAEPDLDTDVHAATPYLLKALNQLPADQRIVVIMREYEGMKFREIAEALNVSENTVKSRMYYGLENLRKILAKWNITKDILCAG